MRADLWDEMKAGRSVAPWVVMSVGSTAALWAHQLVDSLEDWRVVCWAATSVAWLAGGMVDLLVFLLVAQMVRRLVAQRART